LRYNGSLSACIRCLRASTLIEQCCHSFSVSAPNCKEAEDRMAAYRSGELGTVDAEKAFSELGKQI
jgi:hypothetical protein